jgi:hypothetical protein
MNVGVGLRSHIPIDGSDDPNHKVGCLVCVHSQTLSSALATSSSILCMRHYLPMYLLSSRPVTCRLEENTQRSAGSTQPFSALNTIVVPKA